MQTLIQQGKYLIDCTLEIALDYYNNLIVHCAAGMRLKLHMGLALLRGEKKSANYFSKSSPKGILCYSNYVNRFSFCLYERKHVELP